MASQRGKKWQGSVTNGTQRIRQAGFDTEQEAVAWEANVRLALSRGEPVSSEGHSPTKETFTQYYRRVHPVLWGDTDHGIKVVNQLKEIAEIVNDVPVSMFTDQHLESIVTALKQRRNSDATINRKLAALSKILTQASKTRVLANKPDIAGYRRKEGRGRLRFITKDEEQRLLAKLQFMRPEYADFTAFLIDTGFRFGEALKFTWADYSDGKVTLWQTKSNTPRTIPLTQRCKDILERCPKNTDRPFGHINRNSYRPVFDKARGMAGLGDDVIPHVMRHTCASRLVQSGVDIRRVQVWLGHSTIAMTMRYSHLAPDDLDVCLDALEGE
jgi:integrase